MKTKLITIFLFSILMCVAIVPKGICESYRRSGEVSKSGETVLFEEVVDPGQSMDLKVKNVSGSDGHIVARYGSIVFSEPQILKLSIDGRDGRLILKLDVAGDDTYNLASFVLDEGDLKSFWFFVPMSPLIINEECKPVLTVASTSSSLLGSDYSYNVNSIDGEGGRFLFFGEENNEVPSNQFVIYVRKNSGR